MTITGCIVEDLDPVADRAGWLAWRRTHIGGSDVAAILGLSNYGSPWSVWTEKMGLVGEEPSDELMEAGRWLEHAIAPWFADRTGLHVIGAQTVIEATHDGIAACTIDGAVAESPATPFADALGGLEIKTRGFGQPWSPIPADVQAQCQWQMYVAGWERTWIPVLMGRRLDIHDLDRDEGDIAFIVDRVHRFWTEHVLTGTPPPTDGSDATLRAIAAVYPSHTPDKSVELDDLVDVVDEWVAAKADRIAAEKREKEAKAAICAALEDAEEGTVAGDRIVSWREQSRTGIDTTRLKSDHPDLAAEYETTTTFRVLREHTSKKKKAQAA